MGEAIGTDTLVPDVLVKLIALIVTAHSRTESEGVSPMFTSTAVDAAGPVVGGRTEWVLEPLPHPIVPAVAIAKVSNVHPAHFPVADRFMIFSPCQTDAERWAMRNRRSPTLFIACPCSMAGRGALGQ